MTTDNAHFDNNSKTDFTQPAANDAQGNVMDLPEVPDDGTEFGGPKGSIITIMGIPKQAEADMTDVTNTIVAAVSTVFDNVEIAHVPNVEIMTADILAKNEVDPDDMNIYGSAEGRAAASLIAHGISAQDRYEEEAELARWRSLTPDQQAKETAEKQAKWDENNRKWAERSETERNERVGMFFDTAQKWATAEGLTETERCHGVAHDLYTKFGTTEIYTNDGGTKEVKPSDDYAQRYDTTFAEQIKSRSSRAAKELFGTPGQ